MNKENKMLKNKTELGNLGEKLARDYLLTVNYIILATKYRCPYGEIDIINKLGSTIIFTEVKLRSNLNYGYPSEAVNKTKRQKIYKTALYFINSNYNINNNYRFDVIEIYKNKSKYVINHIKNAFTAQL